MTPKDKKLITLLQLYDKLNEENKLEVLEYARRKAANTKKPKTHK